MKNLLTILLLLPVIVFGQQTTQHIANDFPEIKHEFGMNLYSMTDMPITRNIRTIKQIQGNLVTNSFFTGMYYKYYFDKNGLRSSFDYFHTVINYEWQSQEYNVKDVFETKSEEIKLGYERLFAVKKYIPYVFSDILYNYGQSKGNVVTYNELTGMYGYYSGKFVNHEFGLALGVGFKYRPIKNLSIGIETSFQSVYYYQRRLSEPGDKYYSFKFFWNPVRILSIGLTF